MVDKISTDFDFALVGGGLQNALLSLSLRQRRPALRLCLIERAERLGGNHTWCFHEDDIPAGEAALVAPLVERRWSGYRVRFPGYERDLTSTYSMVSSDRLHEVVSQALADAPGSMILTGAEAVSLSADCATLADGRVIKARTVVDARGPGLAKIDDSQTGYQKFVGLECRTTGPHGVERPVVMDARIEQIDGFRFMYVLPLDEERLLLEDTRFSEHASLDRKVLEDQVHAYAQARGYRIAEVLRTEQGVLPLPWAADVEASGVDQPLRAGFQGGWFHPVTGYSFPIAVRLASHIASCDQRELRSQGLEPVAREHRRQLAFGYRLNKMFFRWFAPGERYHVLERFYSLPEPVIRRFYAMQTTGIDRARILVGRPPRGMSYRAALFGRSVS